MNDPSPVGSEFESAEEAESYLRGLKAKVAESRADTRPTIEHDEAMERVYAIIKARPSRSDEAGLAGDHSGISKRR
jgi:hypothetical protein